MIHFSKTFVPFYTDRVKQNECFQNYEKKIHEKKRKKNQNYTKKKRKEDKLKYK